MIVPSRSLSPLLFVMTLIMTAMLCIVVVDGFVVIGASERASTARYSVGNLFAGITGIPPSALLNKQLSDSILERTSLDGVELDCAYKASRDGWLATDFHKAVDGRGSGLVVALSRSGALFGGFNPLGWRSTDDYSGSTSAFLWFSEGDRAKKCSILTGGNAAIFDYATGGPCFGAADLSIGSPKAAVMGGFAGPDMMDASLNAGSLKEGSSSLGGAYTFVNGWPARGKFQLSEVEVYCNSNVKNEDVTAGWWPFG